MPSPVEIVALGKPEVRIVWDDDVEHVWAARDLRLQCSCATCVHELTGQALLDPASVPTDLTVTSMRLVGNYGVNITFSDGHGTGIYRFDRLFANPPSPPS
jgi:DUF971 family protein